MSSFARNVLSLGGGNFTAQLISILAVPVITRLCAPDEFGAFSFVFSLVAVLFPIATLRLNSAILLPKDEETADELLRLSVISVFLWAFLLMPILALILGSTASVDEPTRAVLWFLVAGVLVHGLVQCVDFWMLRHRKFGVMAWGVVGESVADRLFVITMGLSQQALASWLALGRIVGGVMHLFVFLQAGKAVGLPWRRRPPGVSTLSILKRYREFPLYSTWAFLLANGGRELPTLVFAGLFSATVAGMYALGVRVLGFPMLLIGDAIAKAFYRYATGLSDQPARLSESTCLLVRCTIYLIFPPMLLLSVAGPQLFEMVFGDGWFDAGRFAQILAMSFLVTFLYRVLSIFFDMYEKQAARLAFDAAQFVGRIGAMLLGGWLGGVEGAVLGLLIATVLVHGAAAVYLLSLIGVGTASAIGLLLQSLINLLPLSVLLVAAGQMAAGHIGAWLLAFIGLVAQLLWLAWREPRVVAYARGWSR